jgi:type VI secretion system ImpM family protein
MTMRSAASFAVGKYPGDPEYLRADGGELVASFGDWIDGGMVDGYERYGAAWPARFAAGRSHAFLWWGDGSAAEFLCGVLAPSRDAVGRPYPLAVLARVPAEVATNAAHVLPLAFGDFLEDVSELIDAVCAAPVPRETLLEKVRALPIPDGGVVARAEADYAEWCRGVHTDRAWDAIFPEGPSSERAGRALDAALAASGGGDAGHVDGVVGARVPLGSGGPGAAVLWLDVFGRLGRWSSRRAVFWSAEEASLVVALGRPEASLLPNVWAPEPANPGLIDLTVPSEAASASGPCSARFAEDGAETSMRDFLAFLSR